MKPPSKQAIRAIGGKHLLYNDNCNVYLTGYQQAVIDMRRDFDDLKLRSMSKERVIGFFQDRLDEMKETAK